MLKKDRKRGTKILAHKHTGKLQPHHHTSYGSLALVVLLAAGCVSLTHNTVEAATEGGGGYPVSAVVPAPTYKNSPSITSVTNGQSFQTPEPVTISGSCPGTSLVEVYRNDVMAGAALCAAGRYELRLSLFRGNNVLISRAYNTNNIASPDSIPITVRLNTSEKLVAQNAPKFYISAVQAYRAAKTNEPLSWQLTIDGGQAPYAVSVDWGDGKTDLFSRTTAGTYELSHAYKSASSTGHYTAVVRATDQLGQTVYLQLVAIVRGPAPVVATTVTDTPSPGLPNSAIVQVAWTALGGVGLATLGFWLGEIRVTRLAGQRLSRA